MERKLNAIDVSKVFPKSLTNDRISLTPYEYERLIIPRVTKRLEEIALLYGKISDEYASAMRVFKVHFSRFHPNPQLRGQYKSIY